MQAQIDAFILDCNSRNLRPATIDTYSRQLRFFQSHVRVVSLAEVTPAAIRAYFSHELARGLSPASVQTAGRSLRAFCNWAVGEGLITVSPMANVKMPRADEPDPDAFTVGEVRRLLDDATPRDKAMVLFLLDTGARMSEAAAVQDSDIDFGLGSVRLTRTKARRPRTVFLGNHTTDALLDYMRHRPGGAGGALWRRQTNRLPLTAGGLQEAIKRLGRRANVQPCAPHRFRRTCALWSLRAGMDTEALVGILGHTSREMLKHYAKLRDDDLRRAHARHGPVDHWLELPLTAAGKLDSHT